MISAAAAASSYTWNHFLSWWVLSAWCLMIIFQPDDMHAKKEKPICSWCRRKEVIPTKIGIFRLKLRSPSHKHIIVRNIFRTESCVKASLYLRLLYATLESSTCLTRGTIYRMNVCIMNSLPYHIYVGPQKGTGPVLELGPHFCPVLELGCRQPRCGTGQQNAIWWWFGAISWLK